MVRGRVSSKSEIGRYELRDGGVRMAASKTTDRCEKKFKRQTQRRESG